ncbi:lambda exonuclease family protein [Endozoicomonas arenosclerae]|uniref:lambda exonuclease family protein n=1 Tax=Endozoicomonas arenosclerae TaxID=1633495 RepID=UPI0007810540|nr:lambda exonuclease family protein [Endozoicomonas arenosclerae]
MRDFYQELLSLAPVLGFDPTLVQQGSEAWHRMRAGVVTASKAEFLLQPDRMPAFPECEVEIKKGEKRGENHVTYLGKSFTGTKEQCKEFVRSQMPKIKPEGKQGYLAELVAQVCTGLIPDEINAKALVWGKEHEEHARDAYSAKTFEIVRDVPLIYKNDSMRFGCSPDGLCSNYGLELKCPWVSKTYIEFICADKIKPEYIKQCQFSMWITDLDRWDFANFDPRMRAKKLHIETIERDEKLMSLFDEAGAEFIADMDAMLSKMGVEFGAQWRENECNKQI